MRLIIPLSVLRYKRDLELGIASAAYANAGSQHQTHNRRKSKLQQQLKSQEAQGNLYNETTDQGEDIDPGKFLCPSCPGKNSPQGPIHHSNVWKYPKLTSLEGDSVPARIPTRPRRKPKKPKRKELPEGRIPDNESTDEGGENLSLTDFVQNERAMGVIRKKSAARGSEGGVKYICDVCSADITSTVCLRSFGASNARVLTCSLGSHPLRKPRLQRVRLLRAMLRRWQIRRKPQSSYTPLPSDRAKLRTDLR